MTELFLYFVSVYLLITFYLFSFLLSQKQVYLYQVIDAGPGCIRIWQPSGGIIVPCNYILFCDPKDHLLLYQILHAAVVFASGSYVTIER